MAVREEHPDVFDGNFVPVEVLLPVKTLTEMGYITVKKQDLLKLRGLLRTTTSQLDLMIREPNIEQVNDGPLLMDWSS